jgi:hypothetical protein
LWGGGLADKRLCWIKWDLICLPKDQGGLGVKNPSLFNKALLSKWNWRFLTDDEAVWADLLKFRYGHLPTHLLAANTTHTVVNSSLWWRDIIGLAKENNENRFMSNIRCGVGDGKNIGFWKFKWFGDRPFSELFSDLFSNEADKDVLIAERLQGNDSDRVWSWNWRQQLSTSEQTQLDAFKVLLLDFTFIPNAVDRWRWMTGSLGLFSVRSCYSLLSESQAAEEIDVNVLVAVKKLWKIDIPSKVLVFGWRLLLEKLPTRSARNHRGILHHSQDLTCPFCSQQVEDINHLFFNCLFSKSVWEHISNWIGKHILTGAECWNNFMEFGKLISSKKGGGRVNRLI